MTDLLMCLEIALDEALKVYPQGDPIVRLIMDLQREERKRFAHIAAENPNQTFGVRG